MIQSAFADPAGPPADAELRAALGKAAGLWLDLVARLAAVGPLTLVWGCTSRKTGWSLRIKRGERTLAYLTPQADCFLASFALGEKAVAAARTARLPAAVLEAIETAPRYPEGRGVRLRVSKRSEVSAALKLVAIKSAS